MVALTCGLSSGCGDNSVFIPEVEPTGPTAQGSAPRSDMIITEVAPSGVGPDWLELHNRGTDPVDRCDFFVTDSLDRLDHYAPLAGGQPFASCEPSLVSPGEFVIVVADGQLDARIIDGVLHAPFKLGIADQVHLVDLGGRAIDSLIYLHESGSDQTLARIPTASGRFFTTDETRGVSNPTEEPQR